MKLAVALAVSGGTEVSQNSLKYLYLCSEDDFFSGLKQHEVSK